MKNKVAFDSKKFHLANLIFDQAEKYKSRAAFYQRNDATATWTPISWQQAALETQTISKALLEIGHKPGDRVGIFSQNMYEAIVADFANIAILGTSVPMYATSTSKQIEFIVNDASIATIFVGEQLQYDTVLNVLETSNLLKTIIVFDKNTNLRGNKNAIYYSEFLKKGDSDSQNKEFEHRLSLANENSITSILYTSGTTGQPKGVMLHEYNYIAAVSIHQERLAITSDKDVCMMFLPLTHVFERAWTYFIMERGVTIYINKTPADIQKTMLEVHPNLMCTVPRYFEKVYAAINTKIASSPKPLQALFKSAVKTGYKRNLEYKSKGLTVPTFLELKYRLLSRPLFKGIRKAAGIDKGKYFPCAGARLSDEINEFMHAIGINIVMGYGLTESTATVSCYFPENVHYKIKSCGKIMPEVDVKISDNGEILLKGRTITAGYYNRPDANRESFTEDGWFKTGDCGYIDNDKNLYITDRIKDLFKTAGGKYIAPQHIEGIITDDMYVEQVAAIGNERKYVSVLIVPNYKAVEEYARAQGATYKSREEMLNLQEVQDLFEHIIKQKNVNFARYEQVKKFTLLPHPFTIEHGHLTNTLKLRRKVINDLFATEIENMYK